MSGLSVGFLGYPVTVALICVLLLLGTRLAAEFSRSRLFAYLLTMAATGFAVGLLGGLRWAGA